MKTRSGATLLELLVVISIIAALLGLTLAGIQKVRDAATRVKSLNNLRQITLGLHHYGALHGGRLPGVESATVLPDGPDGAVLAALVPFIDGQVSSISPTFIPGQPVVITPEVFDRMFPRRSVFLSPADPSLAAFDQDTIVNPLTGEVLTRSLLPPVSYAFNMVGFEGPPRLAASFTDGMTTTVAIAERYAMSYRHEGETPQWNKFTYAESAPPGWYYLGPTEGRPALGPDLHGSRRPTFADRAWGDVYPVTNAGFTRPSVAGRTFQVRPPMTAADASVPQTPFASGLPVAMFDGSVRTLSPSMSETVFWALVTPNGSEVIGSD